MKKIKLPVSNMVTSKVVNLRKPPIVKQDGRIFMSLGTIDVGKAANELDQVRENAALVIWFAIHIEQQLDHIIADYLFGPVVNGPVPGRDFFNNHIVNTDALGYAKKWRIFMEIIKESKPIEGEELNKLNKLLADVMKMRNAFAHGKIIAHADSEPSISFFSGTNRSIQLTEQFWVDIERDFTELGKVLTEMRAKLLKKWVKTDLSASCK